MSDEPYVNWVCAPNGTNAIYYDPLFGVTLDEAGLPSHTYYWEKWEGVNVFQYNCSDKSWKLMIEGVYCLDPELRIFRPKEEIASAKRKNTAKDYSKVPENTRVVEPVEGELSLHQVHKYIKENLDLWCWTDGADRKIIKLQLAGEVISEIEM